MSLKSTAVLLVIIALLPGIASARIEESVKVNTDEVQSTTLDNGMKVLVIENHRAPVAVSQVWYKVGSSYEHDGISGVSHVLEHMMFKGTQAHPAGEFSEIIAQNGGEENAFTGQDYTAYFQKIANDRLEICLQLEADRMRNLVLDKEEFLKELEVVKEERRLRTEDVPTSLTYERFNAVAYINSPYRRPVIGWMEDLDTLTVDDARKWYQTWYAPNNATLVVAGDVQAAEVFRLARKYFGDIATSKIPALKSRAETRHYGTQRVAVELPAKVGYIVMGYKAPQLEREDIGSDHEWELYALEVLAGVLDGGYGARLSKNLIRGKEIASTASAGYGMTEKHDTLFTLSAVPNEGVLITDLESALREEVNDIRNKPPAEDELERVKAQVVAGEVYQQDSVFYQAMNVGMLETIGLPWQIKDEYVEKIMAVTPEQVQQVANKYLTDERLTVAVLEPQPIENGSEEKIQSQMPLTGGAHVR